MGKEASHVAMECSFQSHPNLVKLCSNLEHVWIRIPLALLQCLDSLTTHSVCINAIVGAGDSRRGSCLIKYDAFSTD
jgi:6-phosphofructokinase